MEEEKKSGLKIYYIIGAIVAVVLFLIMLTITSISATVAAKKEIKDTKQYGKDTIVIRCYMDDDYDNAVVKYVRISPKNATNLDAKYIPEKEGYDFCGYYDSADYTSGNVVVTANGFFVKVPSEATLLYPLFTESKK